MVIAARRRTLPITLRTENSLAASVNPLNSPCVTISQYRLNATQIADYFIKILDDAERIFSIYSRIGMKYTQILQMMLTEYNSDAVMPGNCKYIVCMITSAWTLSW